MLQCSPENGDGPNDLRLRHAAVFRHFRSHCFSHPTHNGEGTGDCIPPEKVLLNKCLSFRGKKSTSKISGKPTFPRFHKTEIARERAVPCSVLLRIDCIGDLFSGQDCPFFVWNKSGTLSCRRESRTTDLFKMLCLQNARRARSIAWSWERHFPFVFVFAGIFAVCFFLHTQVQGDFEIFASLGAPMTLG